MNIKDCQIDFLRWVLQTCSTSLCDAVVLEDVKVKKHDAQDTFYLDSDYDMKKLYSYYEKEELIMWDGECHRTPKWVAENCKVREKYRALKSQQLKAEICAEMRDAVDNMQDGIADGLKSMVREWERKLSAV